MPQKLVFCFFVAKKFKTKIIENFMHLAFNTEIGTNNAFKFVFFYLF